MNEHPHDLAAATSSLGQRYGDEMSSEAIHDEHPSDVSDPEGRVPDWLVLGFIVMAGSAGYTLLAYLLWLWTS